MAQPRYLRNAPISEAILDLRVSLPKEFQPEAFAQMKAPLADRYPKVIEARNLVAQFEFKPGQQSTARQTIGNMRGFWFKSADDLNIAQFRVDGFTHNRLRPYTRWEEFFPEAMRLWDLYKSIARPAFVTRIALRYINHLRLPLKDGDDLDQYLTALPPMPPGAPGGYSGLLTRVATHDPQSNISSNVTQALEGSVGSTEPAIILDIDVYNDGELATDAASLQPGFEALRNVKNSIFFGSITDHTAGLFA